MRQEESQVDAGTEIRHMIYEQLLVVAPHTNVWHARLPCVFNGTDKGQTETHCHPPYVQVLQVCKIIYLEAVNILYARNAFTTWTLDETRKSRAVLLNLSRDARSFGGANALLHLIDSRRSTASRIFEADFQELSGLLPGSSRMGRPQYNDGLQALFAFPAFLRSIGRPHASKIKALQLPIDDYPGSQLVGFFTDILQQHIPGLEQLHVGKRPLS